MDQCCSLDWDATFRLQRAMALDGDACMLEHHLGLSHNEVDVAYSLSGIEAVVYPSFAGEAQGANASALTRATCENARRFQQAANAFSAAATRPIADAQALLLPPANPAAASDARGGDGGDDEPSDLDGAMDDDEPHDEPVAAPPTDATVTTPHAIPLLRLALPYARPLADETPSLHLADRGFPSRQQRLQQLGGREPSPLSAEVAC